MSFTDVAARLVATGLTDGTIDSSEMSAVFNPFSPAVSAGRTPTRPTMTCATFDMTTTASAKPVNATPLSIAACTAHPGSLVSHDALVPTYVP